MLGWEIHYGLELIIQSERCVLYVSDRIFYVRIYVFKWKIAEIKEERDVGVIRAKKKKKKEGQDHPLRWLCVHVRDDL